MTNTNPAATMTATVTGLDTIKDYTVTVPLTGDELMVLASHVKASANESIAQLARVLEGAEDPEQRALAVKLITSMADQADELLRKLNDANEIGMEALWNDRRKDGKWRRKVAPARRPPLKVTRPVIADS